MWVAERWICGGGGDVGGWVDLYPCIVIRGRDTSHLRYSRTSPVGGAPKYVRKYLKNVYP